MQSAYHNCPTIGGGMQAPGRQYAAGEVAYRADDRGAEFRLNLAGAYPPEAHLESWRRSLRLDRDRNQIELADEYALKQRVNEITLTLMTPCAVNTETAGTLALTVAPGSSMRVLYDSAVFKPAVEEVRIDDARLRSAWGDRVFRILLKAASPPTRARWTLRMT